MRQGFGWSSIAAAVVLAIAAPAAAQVRTVDPSSAEVRAALAPSGSARAADAPVPEPGFEEPVDAGEAPPPAAAPTDAPPPAAGPADTYGATYREEEVLGKAEAVFGKGAEGLAKAVRSVLGKQGEPNAYIAGREGGAAFAVGLRYGQGQLFHKVEGEREVFWSGPSLGFDVGANGSKTFVLIYNLYDSEDLFRRFPAAEGSAYLVGGFTISYLRRGDIVLVPIRLGVGWRLGANVGYMKFTHKAKWLPF